MSSQSLIIYKFSSLYHILEELSLDLNFKIIFIDTENSLNEKIKNTNNFLVISNKKHPNIGNQFFLPIQHLNLNSSIRRVCLFFTKIVIWSIYE